MRAFLRLGVVACLAASLSPASAADSDSVAFSDVAASLAKGDPDAARLAAAGVLVHDPRDARMHLLNGLAYQMAAERGDGASYDLAKVGYQTSVRFDPNDYWAHELLGVADFETRDWRGAQESFAEAVLLRPDDWRAQEGLAASSYYAGDLGLAALSAARAAKLAPNEPVTLRTAALVAAATGNANGAAQYVHAYQVAGGTGDLATRVELVDRSLFAQNAAAPAAAPTPPVQAQPATPPMPAPAPTPAGSTPDSQLLVEVTLILSDDTIDRSEGVNLLEGLQGQFGFSASETAVTGKPTVSFARTITGTLAVPQVTYSLNLFNRTRSYYWVMSRPTLTAYLGQESDFFVGHTVSVPVAGVNLGTLQSVDAGTSLKLTPLEIDADKVRFKIDANRSFFDPVSQIQGFSQQISVFKESADATAELQYGQSLILSGLSENTTDSNENVVPGASDVPILGEFFGNTQVQTQRTSVLILVTPLPPVETNLPHRLDRDGAVAQVTKLWTSYIDPKSDTQAIVSDLSRYFGKDNGAYGATPAEQSDISLEGPSDKRLLADAVKDVAN